jgi:hypothetical protein
MKTPFLAVAFARPFTSGIWEKETGVFIGNRWLKVMGNWYGSSIEWA